MKSVLTRGVGLLLCLALTPLLTGQDDTRKSTPTREQPDVIKQIPEDLLKEILDQDIDKLVDELGLAVSIDRTGQKLMRIKAQAEAKLHDKRRIQVRYLSDPQVATAAEMIQQSSIHNQLYEIQKLPEEDRQAALQDFLDRHKLNLSTFKKAIVLVDLNELIRGYEEDLNKAKELLVQHARRIDALEDTSTEDIVGILNADKKHHQTINDELKRIESHQKQEDSQITSTLQETNILGRFSKKK